MTDSAIDVLMAMEDENSRKILLAITSRAMSIEEISSQTGVPTSTCYKKVRELEAKNLIRSERETLTETRRKSFSYLSCLKKATISFDGANFKIEPVLNSD